MSFDKPNRTSTTDLNEPKDILKSHANYNGNHETHQKQHHDVSIIFTILIAQFVSLIFICFNIEEYSPLILFSWWRNKIS